MTLRICLAQKDYLINDNLFTCTCSLFESSFIHYMLRQKWRGGGQSHDISNFIYVKLRKVSAANIVGEVEPAPSMLRVRACVGDVCTRCALEYYNVAKTEV